MNASSPPTPGAVAVNSGGTAKSIREAATELFANHGYEATTMNAIGRSVGIRGSALYNHVPSKQELLREIMFSAMSELVELAADAINSTDEIPEQLRLGIRQHVLYHAQSRLQTRVGNREIPSLEEPAHTEIIERRRCYVEMFKSVIDAGIAKGIFQVKSSLLATHSILQSGMGVASWYDPAGPMSGTEVADLYGEFALRIVGFRG